MNLNNKISIERWALETVKNGFFTSRQEQLYFKGIAENGLRFEGWANPITKNFESLYPVLSWDK